MEIYLFRCALASGDFFAVMAAIIYEGWGNKFKVSFSYNISSQFQFYVNVLLSSKFYWYCYKILHISWYQ